MSDGSFTYQKQACIQANQLAVASTSKSLLRSLGPSSPPLRAAARPPRLGAVAGGGHGAAGPPLATAQRDNPSDQRG